MPCRALEAFGQCSKWFIGSHDKVGLNALSGIGGVRTRHELPLPAQFKAQKS